MIYYLSILALLSGLLCIRAKYKVSQYQLLIFKPLTLFLIISIVILFPVIDQKYKIFILTGLLFSLLGDVFLIFPQQHFTKGLLAFLLGHVFYIIAFIVSAGFYHTEWIYLPIVLVSILYLKNILPYSGKKTIPIIIYIIIIAIMGWMALERLYSLQTLGALLAATGAILFMISDSILALNKFKKRFRSAELIILLFIDKPLVYYFIPIIWIYTGYGSVSSVDSPHNYMSSGRTKSKIISI
jgi:uncharacterized membrane protein YhhN